MTITAQHEIVCQAQPRTPADDARASRRGDAPTWPRAWRWVGLDDPRLPRLLQDVRVEGDCWIWTGTSDGRGYGQLTTHNRHYSAHRLSCEIAKGPIPSGLVVMHACDVPPCICPDHLFVGTQSDNIRDMFNKGRFHREYAKGEDVPGHVLTTLQVLETKQLLAVGLPERKIAARFEVGRNAIRYIKRGETWRHVILPVKCCEQEVRDDR